MERNLTCREGLSTLDLRQKLAFLSDARSYGGAVEKVEVRETHMSWVFLAGDYAFKLKKPVRFPYLDFSTLAKRQMACRAEVELNRRLARDVYLGAVPLSVSDKGLAIGEGAMTVDWLVKMRRLNEGRMFDNLIARNRADRHCLDAIVLKLSDFYRRANAVSWAPMPYLKQWKLNLQQNRGVLLDRRFGLAQAPTRYCDRMLQQFLRRWTFLLLSRLRRRRILDGHGDLRPEHIWLGDEVKIIDCIEFNARLRAVDPLEEIAYLDLECEHLGMKGAGDYIRPRVMLALHDAPPLPLFHFYRCYRAMLRARLSIAHLLAPRPRTPHKWGPQALAYLRIAEADARRLEKALSRQADRKEAYPRAGGGWTPPEGGHRKEPAPYPASGRASRGKAARYPW